MMFLVANTPNPLSGVGLMIYAGFVPLGFGTGLGYPGALITLAFVGSRTIHSLCPSGSDGPLSGKDGIVVKRIRVSSLLWSFFFASRLNSETFKLDT